MGAGLQRMRCFAKVNLGLQVTGRRDDGLHDLRSVLHTIDLHDTLEYRPAAGLSLRVTCEGMASGTGPADGPDNLVLRAAAAAGLEGGEFTLTKRIPAGAGLGGGSSDAAATLLAVRPDLEMGELHRIAAGLGSDVPFFLYGGACLALGRGDEIYPLPEQTDLHLALAFPGHSLSTPEVYRAWDDSLTSDRNPGRVNDFAAWSGAGGDGIPGIANDLEEAAIRIRPSLKDLRSTLERSGARAVAMTGSGSAFFGIFDDARSAKEGARRVGEAGFTATAVRSISRAERDREVRERQSRDAD
jgi:4-diphosphocytidyl-2-C-methyl-D-erythritol kinase